MTRSFSAFLELFQLAWESESMAMLEDGSISADLALLELATGGMPYIAQPVAELTDPFAHPDAQRRFRVMSDVEELERALNYPWENG